MTLSKARIFTLFIVMLIANVGIVSADELELVMEGQSTDYSDTGNYSYAGNDPVTEVDYLNTSTQINDGYSITTVEEKLDNKNNVSVTDKFRVPDTENSILFRFFNYHRWKGIQS